MKIKKCLATATAVIAMTLICHAAPSAQSGSVTVGWSYDYTIGLNSTVTSWNIYVGTNAAAIQNWDGNTNTCRCYQYTIATGTTNLTATITGLTRGATYYLTVTPTTPQGEEGDFCNEARSAIPTKPGKGSSLLIIQVQ